MSSLLYRNKPRFTLSALVVASVALLGSAHAQDQAPAPAPATPDPAPEAPPPPPPPPPPPKADAKYDFGKAEEVKAVEWKATASAGFSAATGNANIITFTGGGLVSRNDGKNKIAMNLEGLYGLTKNLIVYEPADPGFPGPLPQVTEEQTTTAAFFKGLLRYDRFFTPNNTGFITFYGGLDIPASKDYFLGGQVGYARQILKTKMHEIFGELGYDFSFDRLKIPEPVAGMMAAAFEPNVFLHSGRLFFGYVLSIGDHSALRLNAEALLNFNPLTIGDRAVGVADATRVNAKAEFTTKIWKPLSFRAAFGLRYNNAPAVNAKLTTPIDHPYHYNQKLDTLTELGLVANFI